MFFVRKRSCWGKLLAILLIPYLFISLIVHDIYFVSSKKYVNKNLKKVFDFADRKDQTNTLDVPIPAGNFDYTLLQKISVRNITILMWTEFYHNKDLTKHIESESPIPKWCRVTFDRQVLSESDALVFHGTGSDMNMKDLPTRRFNVPWVYFVIESPIYMQRDIKEFNGLFNRTMSYRLDSDYSTPYGFLFVRPKPLRIVRWHFPNKTKLVVWMVSHCAANSRRETLVEQLKKHIEIDVYGGCGTLQCSKTAHNAEESCYEKLGFEYLFYLSFENSLCKDYITEKFTNALKYNLVPIVYGGGNYTAILPYPKSFIDVRSYKSAEELADYLKYLNFNRTAYAEYFQWRKYYDISIRQGYNGFKKLCYALQRNETGETKIYSDMYNWWDVEGKCKTGLDVEWNN